MSPRGMPVYSSRRRVSTSCRYGCTAHRSASARAGSLAVSWRTADSRPCSSAPSAIRVRIDFRLEDAGGCSILRMNFRTLALENCCNRRGRSSLRTTSFRRRACAGSDTRSSWGRGECSSKPYPLSTSAQRSCARSPSTRMHAVYSLRWPLRSLSPDARVVSPSTRALMRSASPTSCRSSICRAKLKKRLSARPSSLGSSGMIIRNLPHVGTLLARIMHQGPDPGRDTRASVW